MSAPLVKLTKKDFVSDQEVRWCPGCADFAILAGVQKLMPELGISREKTVFISGIGCASRFPYYMNTYGFHGIHGRAPAIATGLKMANPDLTVWVVTGDGDGLSIGGNHLIHALRRNVDLKILLFDNRIYGLTKGQASPTSELGKKTKSSPFGTVDRPFNPLTLALGAGATFVARTTANDMPHMASVLKRAAAHRGAAFVEIWQNCVVFNDGAFDEWSEKDVRDERLLKLEHGKALVYGKGKDKGLRIGGGFTLEMGAADGAVVHDEARDNLSLALALASLEPPWPQAMGVLRAVDRPTVDQLAREQERGLAHIESAELYGTEEMVADAIGGRRDEIFLVSKVLPSNGTRKGTIRSCEQSLQRLRTDRLDCYLLHWRGEHPLEDTIAAFEELQASGKIRSYGVSNFDEDLLERAVAIAGRGRIACNQVLYNLG